MANADNICSDLDVRDYYSENGYEKGESSLADLYDLQVRTQKMYAEKQGKKWFDEMTIGEIVDFQLLNKHCIEDEIGEMLDAIGGMHDGVGNASWKPWKSVNPEIRAKKLSDLSERDRKELAMEWIDMMHFVFNAGIALGITPKDFYNLYLAKNAENWDRQKRGY